jgi:hypothetical protein
MASICRPLALAFAGLYYKALTTARVRTTAPFWGWPTGYIMVEKMSVKLGGESRRVRLITMMCTSDSMVSVYPAIDTRE